MQADFLETLRISFLSQVLFLTYHYYVAAAEIYMAIWVFIAASVWVTAFGNSVVNCSKVLTRLSGYTY